MATSSDDQQGLLQYLCGKWWFCTLTWWLSAFLILISLTHSGSKMMLTLTANLVATAVVAVILMARSDNFSKIHVQFGSILPVAILTGFERTLTNASLYAISASLKTMLHAFNVPFTVVASAVIGADQNTRSCLFGCECILQEHRRTTLALTFITMGAILAALDGSEVKGNLMGIALQLMSGCAYAMKYAYAKLILSSTGDEGSGPTAPRPSKMEVSVVTFPVTALVSLCLLPVFDSTQRLPNIWDSAVTGTGIVGILVSELRLTELTDAVTVSVLGAAHNVLFVAYFVTVEGEAATVSMLLGFALSTVGSLIYAHLGAKPPKSTTDILHVELESIDKDEESWHS